MVVQFHRRAVSLNDFFIHAHKWAVINGLIPRFELLSHVQAKRLIFKEWLILETNPFLESKPFSPKSAYFRKMA